MSRGQLWLFTSIYRLFNGQGTGRTEFFPLDGGPYAFCGTRPAAVGWGKAADASLEDGAQRFEGSAGGLPGLCFKDFPETGASNGYQTP